MKKIFQNINLNPADGLYDKLIGLAYYMLIFLYLEITLHLIIYKSISTAIIYPILFALVAGCALFFISCLLPQRVNCIIGTVVISVAVIYFEVQLVYHCIFGTFMAVSQMMMGTDAVTNFFSQLIHAMVTNIFPILLLLVPIPLTIVLFCKKIIKPRRITLVQVPLTALIGGALYGLTMLVLVLFNTSENSALAMLHNPNTSSEVSIQTVGLAATTVQETQSFIAAQSNGANQVTFLDTTLDDVREGESGEVNQLNIDFAALSESTEDETLRRLDEYVSSLAPTNKNEYTGIAKDYNLITICAEAFSPLVIDEQLTPTLYKLSHGGFIFNNFYNSFPNTTTNGEYTFCTGLLPNMSRNKIESSFNLSADNYMAYCLGNVYTDMGYKAYGYHNYYATFYDRHITHTNMGYDFKAISKGLNIPVQNPCSDHLMMEQAIPDFINSKEPFHAYFMTYSGHYQYDWNNDMSLKHKNKVDHLPYSDTVKAYIACNLELEYALQSLTEALEKAGKADNTVIVITTDHYPYGLPGENYNELAGHDVEPVYERYENAFICYVPGMEPVEVNDYCSSADILPTVLNIMGIEYDSRLLAGHDVLSDAPDVAMLFDQSFITEGLRYNAATGVATTDDGSEVDPELLQQYRNYVANQFTLSTAILDSDYYAHVFDRASDTNVDEGVVNYSDIISPYVEAAVTYVVEQGYITPESDTVFGEFKEEENSAGEFITILYRVAGTPEVNNTTEQEDALFWAIENGIVQDAAIWDTDVTYAEAAYMIYQFKIAETGIVPKTDAAELAVLAGQFPDIPEDRLIAMKWCADQKIMNGHKYASAMELYDQPITLHQTAAYVQRMCLLDLYA